MSNLTVDPKKPDELLKIRRELMTIRRNALSVVRQTESLLVKLAEKPVSDVIDKKGEQG